MLVNITGDESGTNAMVIISESSNLTEKNKSGKENVSESVTDLTKLVSMYSLNLCFVSTTFNNLTTD